MKQDKKITFARNTVPKSIRNNKSDMKISNKYLIGFQSFMILFMLIFVGSIHAATKDFVVVLDAGHGGHDPGAVGSIAKEKDLNLAVVLNLGSIIENNYKDVKVVYTRKTDKYLTLQERADIVNENHADLFICIHTNSATSKSAVGAETFTLGLAKSKSNLDVAMRENSVILLEDNYKTKYKGFDPNSVDSYIMFEFMQDKYIDKSVEFSSIVQKQFASHCKRVDRGVRQAGFWVLHRSACPSVLVELGFVSNPAEERYLSSKQGQNEMSTAIYNAFVDFKYEHDRRSGISPSTIVKAAKAEKNDTKANDIVETVKTTTQSVADSDKTIAKVNPAVAEKVIKAEDVDKTKNTTAVNLEEVFKTEVPVFKVQLFAASKKIPLNSREFKGVRNPSFFQEGVFYKYTVGEETDFKNIEKIKSEVASKFPNAFIVAFVGAQKMSAVEALKLIK